MICNNTPCNTVDGHWSTWASWGSCTVSCGGGYKQRHRYCNNPYPSQFGKVCIGSDIITVPCNTHECVKVRLTGGSGSTSGRVEVFMYGQWGTICDDSFDSTDAGVICVMLGHQRADAVAKSEAYFGQGSSSMLTLLDDLQCNGDEASIAECHHSVLEDCSHAEDAGVICATNGAVRLSGSSSTRYQGRVEIYLNHTWGTICDDSFDNEDAQVVCRMLGLYSSGAVAKGSAYFGPGSSSILLDDISCSGSESSVLSCSHSPIGTHNCGHGEDAGVICLH
ncbi:neurotrypsin-like [Mya arenaria]|uniref:neurotrypsin-like n=1 Tax=Mya arenaria TaxID=6604 RepID=UPI0022E46D3B|nr:neurotrypsin-like [Mya arenaria]